MKIPDRWLNYSEGARISCTRFVAFKVPLKEGFNKNLPPHISFTPSRLLELFPNLKLVIDLTFTRKYYNGEREFEARGIKYVKLKCKGHVIPSNEIFKEFVEIVDEFIDQHPQDDLIGVHCTHGVNRTGYLIARYMIERLGYTPTKALRDFGVHRGHAIERKNYEEDLMQRSALKYRVLDCQMAEQSRGREMTFKSESFNSHSWRKKETDKSPRKNSYRSRGVEKTGSKNIQSSQSIFTNNRFSQLSVLDLENY